MTTAVDSALCLVESLIFGIVFVRLFKAEDNVDGRRPLQVSTVTLSSQAEVA